MTVPEFPFCQSWCQNIHQRLHKHKQKDGVGFCRRERGEEWGREHGREGEVRREGQLRRPRGQRLKGAEK